MTLGRSPKTEDVFRSSTQFCRDHVSPTSVYALLHRESHRLFPDEAFADLFRDIGRASVPPQIVAVVMVLQRLEGVSDREAVDRISFDLRWKYAAGGLAYDYPGFVHTVLVDMRARLRRSERPNRIFETALEVARQAGLVGRKRALDSTPLYDAVATQDTVTLIRSAIRGLLRAAGKDMAAELRACLKRDDDYEAPGKPVCDWDDASAREALVDALARDAYALLTRLDGCTISPELSRAAKLLATVVGQDLERSDGDGDGSDGSDGDGSDGDGSDGDRFRIARRVAPDRVISTVDPEARHGHKTSARGFDGYKGHIAIDPDSEIITASEVTSGNVADGCVTEALIDDVLHPEDSAPSAGDQGTEAGMTDAATTEAVAGNADTSTEQEPSSGRAEIYGDACYGTADLVEVIEAAGAEANVKVQPPSARTGHYTKDAFEIDLEAQTVTCPAGVRASIRPLAAGGGLAAFADSSCASCILRAQCTTSKHGRQLRVHPKEATLRRSRERQRSDSWKARYRATRPKVERKIGHLMFRRHGGRRARVRGRVLVGHDFALLAAAHNIRRMAALGIHYDGVAWQP